MVADAEGRTRTALVGRVKIEGRPLVSRGRRSWGFAAQLSPPLSPGGLLPPSFRPSSSSLLLSQVLVEAELPDGERCSVLLQNAETVRVVGPASSSSGSSGGGSGSSSAWRAVSVSQLAAGDQLYVLRQAGARHTGVAIEESITER